MSVYTNNSMVKKGHIKIIAEELKKLGSKVPSNLDLEKDHSLANILYLATGNSKYKLSREQINQIKNDDFSIDWK